jgi:hypothetical protein
MKETHRPLARTEDLVVEELQDEVLVYDRRNNKVHCLNPAAASVWRLCDGKRTLAEMTKRLTGEGLTAQAGEQVVLMALQRLSRLGLLVKPYKRQSSVPAMTRRQALQKLGLTAAVALPLITSMVAPTAAQAATPPGCAGAGEACSTGPGGAPCCGGLSCVDRGAGFRCG